MRKTIFTLFCGLFLAASIQAGEWCQATVDVVKPRVPDNLCRVTLNQQELGGEIDRRIQNLIHQNYMVIDLDGKWLNHFRNRTDRGDRQYVYYGIGKVFDAGSLFAAYTGDPKVAARTQYIIDELVKSRDADGYLGFWNVEPENRQDHINWILHEQEYINLAFVRNYRCTGNPQSLAHAKIMGDYILKTFPTPQNPCYNAGDICTAGLPEGMLELYRVTGDKRYFDFAADVPHGNNHGEVQLASLRTWEQDFSHPPRHVYVMLARCYAQTELYRLTGEENLLHMSQLMRNELLKKGEGGMLVTGSCSDGEQFTYNQNGTRCHRRIVRHRLRSAMDRQPHAAGRRHAIRRFARTNHLQRPVRGQLARRTLDPLLHPVHRRPRVRHPRLFLLLRELSPGGG